MLERKNNNKYARYSGLAFEMLGIIFLGTWGGSKLDSKRQAEFPLFTVIFSLCSVFIALYVVIKDVTKNGT